MPSPNTAFSVRYLSLAMLLLVSLSPGYVRAQNQSAASGGSAEQQAREKLFEDFENTVSGSAMIGNFLVDGKEDAAPQKERYEISRVKKLEEGDYWLFQARIKYGDHDVAVPIPVEVKWAGNTPVITVDNVTIPGLGTFDARVVIADQKYAGTWRHGKIGGHLFGRIEKLKNGSPEETGDDAESE